MTDRPTHHATRSVTTGGIYVVLQCDLTIINHNINMHTNDLLGYTTTKLVHVIKQRSFDFKHELFTLFVYTYPKK